MNVVIQDKVKEFKNVVVEDTALIALQLDLQIDAIQTNSLIHSHVCY